MGCAAAGRPGQPPGRALPRRRGGGPAPAGGGAGGGTVRGRAGEGPEGARGAGAVGAPPAPPPPSPSLRALLSATRTLPPAEAEAAGPVQAAAGTPRASVSSGVKWRGGPGGPLLLVARDGVGGRRAGRLLTLPLSGGMSSSHGARPRARDPGRWGWRAGGVSRAAPRRAGRSAEPARAVRAPAEAGPEARSQPPRAPPSTSRPGAQTGCERGGGAVAVGRKQTPPRAGSRPQLPGGQEGGRSADLRRGLPVCRRDPRAVVLPPPTAPRSPPCQLPSSAGVPQACARCGGCGLPPPAPPLPSPRR